MFNSIELTARIIDSYNLIYLMYFNIPWLKLALITDFLSSLYSLVSILFFYCYFIIIMILEKLKCIALSIFLFWTNYFTNLYILFKHLKISVIILSFEVKIID